MEKSDVSAFCTGNRKKQTVFHGSFFWYEKVKNDYNDELISFSRWRTPDSLASASQDDIEDYKLQHYLTNGESFGSEAGGISPSLNVEGRVRLHRKDFSWGCLQVNVGTGRKAATCGTRGRDEGEHIRMEVGLKADSWAGWDMERGATPWPPRGCGVLGVTASTAPGWPRGRQPRGCAPHLRHAPKHGKPKAVRRTNLLPGGVSTLRLHLGWLPRQQAIVRAQVVFDLKH